MEANENPSETGAAVVMQEPPDSEEKNGDETESQGQDEKDEPSAKGDEPDDLDPSQVPAGWQLCAICGGGGLIPEGIRYDPETEQCGTCGGHGRVLTGSLDPDHRDRLCNACQGAGYLQRQPAPQLRPPSPPQQLPPPGDYGYMQNPPSFPAPVSNDPGRGY